MSDSSPPMPGIWRSIRSVFRQNWVACLLLNGVVILLVTTYEQVPVMAAFWDAVGAFKARWSYAFSLGSTVFAAALLPFLIQSALGTWPQEGRWRRLLLMMLFWGYRGMEIDLFYRFQGSLFGHGYDVRTLVMKVALDQFVFSPLWFVPSYLIALRWMDLGGSWQRTKASLDRTFWTQTCPTVMITNWLVWIPTLALLYSLPPALQFPLFSVVMCFFILIVTVLAAKSEGRENSRQEESTK